MNRIERRMREAVNPASTAVTAWWCHSALRHLLTGYGPNAGQRRLRRHGMTRGDGFRASAEHVPAERMKARAAAIDQLLGQDDRQM